MSEIFADIEGQKVLITGASGGMGSAMARLFAEQGAVVGVHYHHNQAGAEEVLAEIEAAGGSGGLFEADLLEAPQRDQMVVDFIDRYGAINVLINNAGCNIAQHYLELDVDAWRNAFILNAEAPFFIAQRSFPYMKQAGGGCIINISSVAVKYGGSDTSIHYGAAKAALENVTIALAKRGAPDNILINTIRAGVIDTEFHAKSPKANFSERVELIPVGRLGKPEEVAQMALFLASKAGQFVTGQVLSVTGGE